MTHLLNLDRFRSAGIVTIGYEILQGRVVDTNSAYLARKLFLMGLDVRSTISVGDDLEDVIRALKFTVSDMGAELVFTTGGLGPTPDDRTLEAIARFLGVELVVNDEALRDIKAKYSRRGVELTPERLKMAKLPQGAVPLLNPVGIAPGIYIESTVGERRIAIVSLPGVPREMEAIFEKYIEPALRKSRRLYVAEGYVRLRVMESEIAPYIRSVMKRYSGIYIKSHPEGEELGLPVVRIYTAAYGRDAERAYEACKAVQEEFISYAKEKGIEVAEHKPCVVH